MTFVRSVSMLLLMVISSAFAQQPAATDVSLRGKWLVPDSKIAESFTFNAGQDFVRNYTFTKKEGKQSETTSRQLDGAYTVGPSACSAGQVQGNLWVVQASERCCFNAYHMGKTLVLDEVRGSSIITMPLCVSRTLKRGG